MIGRIVLIAALVLAFIGLAVQAFPGVIGVAQVLIFFAFVLIAYNLLG